MISVSQLDNMLASMAEDVKRRSLALDHMKEVRQALTITRPKRRLHQVERQGMVQVLVPIIRKNGGLMRVSAMLLALKQSEGYKSVSRESLEATLSNEGKRLTPRLVRVAPGTYRVSMKEDDQIGEYSPKAA